MKSTYDALGRKRLEEQEVLAPVGTAHLPVTANNTVVYRTMYEYDMVGNVVRVVNPANQVLEKQCNGVYWLEAEITYNALYAGDNWTSLNFSSDPYSTVDQSMALVNRYQYDSVGLKRLVVDPSAKAMQYYYDGVGRLTSVVDAGGNATDYEYDKVGIRQPKKIRLVRSPIMLTTV